MDNEHVPTIIYRDRLVAFIDIMGFKELLKGQDCGVSELQKFYDKVFDYLHEKGRIYERSGDHADEFKKLIVSDAIVLSVIIPKNQSAKLKCCARFFAAISLLQGMLAFEQDIWLRGAVSLGKLFIDEKKNILVGPAFIKAFNLEVKADYPRVIIDPAVCEELNLSPKDFISQVNALEYKNVLLSSDWTIRTGRASYNVDAIQIDWFKFAWESGISTEYFFRGLKKRMVTNQDLYLKSLKLGRYLRESYDLQKDRSPHVERLDNINLELEKIGF